MELSHLASLEEAAAVERAARENYYAEKTAPDSFWLLAAASLPPRVRRRYFHLFEAAERWDPVVDFVVDACRFKSRESGKSEGREPGKRFRHHPVTRIRPHGV